MSRWIRLYQNALHNPKIVSLSDRQFRAWNNCLLMADDTEGTLPKIRDIACHLRMSIQDAELVLSELVEVDLIDMEVMNGVRTFTMHDWRIHQYVSDVSTERVRKFRNKIKTETNETPVKRFETVSVTPPDTDTDTDTERDTPLPPTGAVRVENALPKFGKLEALEAFNAYNAAALVLALPQAAKLTPDRARRIIARLNDYGLDGWHKAIANLHGSKFLTGKTDQGFRADLDFVCQAKSFGKLHDGGYGNAPSKASKPASTFAHPRRDDDDAWKDKIAAEMWAADQAFLEKQKANGAMQ